MCHGRRRLSSTLCTPAVYRDATSIMPANASSVSTSPSVARMAAIDRALPASVPPTPPVSSMSASWSPRMRSLSSSVRPSAPAGMPPAIDLPMVRMSGCRPSAAVQPPGPALNVCVSSLISSVPYSAVSARTASR